MYFGDSVVGKASLIDPEISPEICMGGNENNSLESLMGMVMKMSRPNSAARESEAKTRLYFPMKMLFGNDG